MSPTILLLGTFDTKQDELLFTSHQITAPNPSLTVLLMDIGRTPSHHPAISIPHPALSLPEEAEELTHLPRAEYIKRMALLSIPTISTLYQRGSIHAIASIGGSCGTGLATAVMRSALPVGFPKLMVSTMASGDVKPYVEETDITMMYSVVDIAGTNRILNRILSNAAAAVAGMAVNYYSYTNSQAKTNTATNELAKETKSNERKRIGITMFGVTTPCVNAITSHLTTAYPSAYEIYVFHATGAGGKAMERLIREGQLDAVLDITTSEIADEVVGGVLSAGAERLSAAAAAGIPQVISLGACDMVNFGALETVPGQFRGRLLHEHNPTVTIMRTTREECVRIGEFLVNKLREHVVRAGNVRVVMPVGGLSMLGVKGQAFWDEEADGVLFETVERGLEGSGIDVVRDERDVNDGGFAVDVAEMLVGLMGDK